VNGFGSTVIYIKLMSKNGEGKEVPVIDVIVTVKDHGGRVQTLKTNSENVNIVGSTATVKDMTAKQPVEMKAEEMSASGDNIFDGPSPIPILTLAMMALLIVFVIAMMWLGLKKGVFVRKR
jgi:hypothetical protein